MGASVTRREVFGWGGTEKKKNGTNTLRLSSPFYFIYTVKNKCSKTKNKLKYYIKNVTTSL